MIKLSELEKYKIFDGEKLINIELVSQQGCCNTVYTLSTSKHKYIIKKEINSLHVGKNHEFFIQNTTHKKLISAKALFWDKENSLLIQEYIHGIGKFELSKKDIQQISNTLKKLHNIKIKTDVFKIEKYLHFNIKDKKLKLVLQDLKRYKQDFVLCHNDLNPKNILFTCKAVFLDWEYASLNDRYFDLASVCVEFKLSKKQERDFMRYYFKNKIANFRKLHTFKTLYKYVCYTWQKDRGNPTCQE
jgi:thiamine kinase-like enzyme